MANSELRLDWLEANEREEGEWRNGEWRIERPYSPLTIRHAQARSAP
jgi:hypothetical protein